MARMEKNTQNNTIHEEQKDATDITMRLQNSQSKQHPIFVQVKYGNIKKPIMDIFKTTTRPLQK